MLYTPFQNWPQLGKKLARVAWKRGHKGQFGWNKNKKVNQSTLRHNCHFSSLSNRFSSPQNMQNSKERTLNPYDLVFIQLVPVFFFFEWQPFFNKVYSYMYTTFFHILHELILIIYYKLCAHLFSNIVYQLGYTVKDIHVHVCIVKYPFIGIICPHVKYPYSSADLTEQWSCFLWTGRGRKLLENAVCRQFATSSWGCSSCSDP